MNKKCDDIEKSLEEDSLIDEIEDTSSKEEIPVGEGESTLENSDTDSMNITRDDFEQLENQIQLLNKSLRKKIKILSCGFILALGAIASVLVGTTIQHNDKIATLNEQLTEVLQVQQEEKSSNSEELAKEFLNSEYVQQNLIKKDVTKSELLSLSNKTYYVLFYMEDCPHCVDLESKLMPYTKRTDIIPMHFYNASQIDDNTNIQWMDAEKMPETITEKNLGVIGTPTLLKVTNKTATSYLGMDDILAELNM